MDKCIKWIQEAVGLCSGGEGRNEYELEKDFQKYSEEYNSFSEQEQNKIFAIMKNAFALDDNIYVHSFLSRYLDNDNFKKQLFELMMCYEEDWQRACAMEMNCNVRIDGMYAEKRRLHTRNIKLIEQKLGNMPAYRRYEEREKKRIIIATEQMLAINHAPTLLVLNCALQLKKYLGYEVVILETPNNPQCEGVVWHNELFMNTTAEKPDMVYTEYMGERFNIFQVPMTENAAEVYSELLNMVYELNPLFIFSVGVLNPIVDILGNVTTVVARNLIVDMPVSDCQIMTECCGKENSEKIYYDEEYGQVVYSTKYDLPMNREHNEVEVKRSDYSYGEDEFLIAIVGNRLDMEIDEEFIQLMKRVSDYSERVRFVIIGNTENLERKFDEAELYNVYYMGYCMNLKSTYKIFDLYMNPFRKGGGHSSVIAMEAGLPAVTLDGGDVALGVGEKFVSHSVEEMYNTICRYLDDEAFCEEMREKTISARKDFSYENSAKDLQHMIDTIENLIKEYEK